MNLIILVLACPFFALGQNTAEAGSIRVSRCDECADIVLKLPEVEYPSYVGFGPHTYEGEVGIFVVIGPNGEVASAKGISGHPYFRPMLEKASLTAKFKPAIVDEKAETRRAVIFYQITPPKDPVETASSRAKMAIINGRATNLRKPEYSQNAENLCASGQVKVEVELDEDGKVLKATQFDGDQILFDVARKAVVESTFRPIPHVVTRSKGVVVYNFVPDRKCADVGNIYGRWREIPTFSIHPHSIIQEETVVIVRLGIDVMNGKVIAATAIGGHSVNRKALELDAMKIVFSPVAHWSPNILAKGFIKLKLKKDRTVTPIP